MKIINFCSLYLFVACMLGTSVTKLNMRLLFEPIDCKVYEKYSDECTDGIMFPDSFYVSERNMVYILDSYSRELRVSSGKYNSTINLSNCGLPSDFIYYGENLYVFDEMFNTIHIYGTFLENETIIDCSIIKNDYFKRFVIIDDSLYIDTFTDTRYSINYETNEISYVGVFDDNIEPAEDLEVAEFWRKDKYGNSYSIQADLNYKGAIVGFIVIVKQSPDGKNQYYVLPADLKDLPVRFLQVDENGNTYVLLNFEDRVEVRKIDFSDKLELPKYPYSSPYSKGSKFGDVDIDREDALDRAIEIINYEWTLTQDNCRISENTSLPRECCYIASKHTEDEWFECMTGVPYCWGGSSSIYKDKFLKQINNGFLAGNMTCKGSYKSNTAGLDCSGYTSIIYDLPGKCGTWTLLDYAKRIKDLDDIKTTDMLIAPGNHVVMFVRQIDDDAFLVCECCGRNGKTVMRVRTFNWFVTIGEYQAMTPW